MAFSSRVYQVVTNRRLRYGVSAKPSLDAANPVQDVVLTLPAPDRRLCRIVESQGQPLGNLALQAELDSPDAGTIYGLLFTTGPDGVVALDLGEGAPTGTLSLRPQAATITPRKYPVTLSASGVATLVIARGQRLRGRIVDHTRAPVGGE